MSLSRLASATLLVAIAGCGGEGETVPAALTAEPLGEGAHLAWEDNSDNETQLMVMRRLDTETALEHVTTLEADTTERGIGVFQLGTGAGAPATCADAASCPRRSWNRRQIA